MIRFGISIRTSGTAAEFREAARAAEASGYSTLLIPDHLGTPAPMVASAVAASVTERLRVGPFVLNNDFRHLAVLAQEAATLDLLSDGRLELGLGAGHMKPEYQAAGLTFDPASKRIDRLAEAVPILRRLFAGETVDHAGAHYRMAGLRLDPPPPQGTDLPVLIGGNGARLLAVAGRLADIVGFVGFTARKGGLEPTPTHFTTHGLADRLEVVRAAAGERLPELELNVLVQRVIMTGDRRGAARGLVDRGYGSSVEDLLDSPFVLIGTTRQIADQLTGLRERLGVSYFTVFAGRSEGFDTVVEELAGD